MQNGNAIYRVVIFISLTSLFVINGGVLQRNIERIFLTKGSKAMKFFKLAARISLTAIFAIIFSGCATSIPPEQQKNYSLLIPKENTGGMVNSTMISKIDGESFYSLAGTSQDVLPGKHEITVTSCFNGSSANCPERHYTLDTKAGLVYVFKGRDVEIYDRFNDRKLLDTLVNIVR